MVTGTGSQSILVTELVSLCEFSKVNNITNDKLSRFELCKEVLVMKIVFLNYTVESGYNDGQGTDDITSN